MTQAHAILEQQLREKVSELLAVVKSIGEETGPLVRDLLDAAFLEQGVGSLLVTLRTEDVHRIEDVLERVTNGTYGLCASCGGKIGAKRLTAIP